MRKDAKDCAEKHEAVKLRTEGKVVVAREKLESHCGL